MTTTTKRGSGETVYKMFVLWNFDWVAYTYYPGGMFTSYDLNRSAYICKQHQTDGAALFVQHS